MMLINFHSGFLSSALLLCYDEADAIFVSQCSLCRLTELMIAVSGWVSS
jgi:hypothetical protein